MSDRSDHIRDRLAASTFDVAQAALLRFIRDHIRAIIFSYAQRHKIMDFADTQLVQQPHRDWRDARISVAQSLAIEAQAATNAAELLAVFDQLAPYVE